MVGARPSGAATASPTPGYTATGAGVSAPHRTISHRHPETASRPRIVVTRRLPAPVEEQLLREYATTLNADDHPFSPAELRAALRAADALVPTVTDQVTAELLAVAGRRTRIIANYGVGFNNIDVAAARALGIVVTNTPEVLTDDTADDAILLLLMVARRAAEGEREVRSGRWSGWRPTHLLGTKVSGKTLGLIGLGRIARAVARRARAGLGMRVIFYDPSPPDPGVSGALGVEPRGSLEDVLRESDFVSLHCPATAQTHHLIDAGRLGLMQPKAFLINNARGDIVDERALVAALRSGTIAGAGLDVYEHEPRVSPELLTMDNVVLLPHIGSATTETRIAMGMRALDNLRAFFAGQDPRDRVA